MAYWFTITNFCLGFREALFINDFHPKWEVVGQKLPLISPADNTKYLGVKVNSWSGVTKKISAKNLNSHSPPQGSLAYPLGPQLAVH
jgi:hypothetical protein